MIELFIYQKSDGSFIYKDVGSIEFVIKDLGIDKDFTLTPPPDYDHKWRWIDSKWTKDDTAN